MRRGRLAGSYRHGLTPLYRDHYSVPFVRTREVEALLVTQFGLRGQFPWVPPRLLKASLRPLSQRMKDREVSTIHQRFGLRESDE